MSLFKILHGDEERISLDITPFHEGWCYVTHNGRFYVDMNIGTEEAPNYQRVETTSRSAYKYAQEGGFTGTEEEFANILGRLLIYSNPPITDTVTKYRRYNFSRVARGITYTDEDHPNKIAYGSSFQFEHTMTDEALVGRTYYGYDYGTLDGGGYISISVPKTIFSKNDKLIPVSYSWSVVNNQRNKCPAINAGLIGIYNYDYYTSSDKPKMTYFDSYEYFGRISEGAFMGTTNANGQYQETIYTHDREGVQRNITYDATKLTSWGYNSTVQVAHNHYSGIAHLDISNLTPGRYRIMFLNLASPDWPLENIIDGSPYQILNELEIEIVDSEVGTYITTLTVAEEQSV